MPTHRVNLDALIAREDFESGDKGLPADQGSGAITLQQLAATGLVYNNLRKPDFQRPTNNWTPEAIVRLVEAFLDGMLIPAVIIWHSSDSGRFFVIDGAHRLGVLIGWVNDDYGDGPISRKFYGGETGDYKRLHDETRKLMHERVGSYQEVLAAGTEGGPGDEGYQKKVRRGRRCNRLIDVQTVEGGASAAERSFLAINEFPVKIDPTELSVTKARKKPNVLATRALMRAGGQYYSHLPRAAEITDLAKKVYGIVFGQVREIDSQSPDVPRAGKPYSQEAFRLVLDMVNYFNEVSAAMWEEGRAKGKSQKGGPSLQDDETGDVVLRYLRRVGEVAALVGDNGATSPGSLGMDMAVYAYGGSGTLNAAAFLGAHKFAVMLRDRGMLTPFTEVRAEFEEFLVRHQGFINQLGHMKGSRTRPLESEVAMLNIVFDSMRQGVKDEGEIIARLKADTRLKDLRDDAPAAEDPTRRRRFSKSVQRAAVVRQILEHRERCAICGARLPPGCRSKDHVGRAAAGGAGSLSNLQFTHPYCNTGFKEQQLAKGTQAG